MVENMTFQNRMMRVHYFRFTFKRPVTISYPLPEEGNTTWGYQFANELNTLYSPVISW